MNYDLRRIIASFVISLVLIRFWIEIITTTLLKKSVLINQINSNKIGFHHWQIGILLMIVTLVLNKFFVRYKNLANILFGIGLAFIFDQYTFILRLFGIILPFSYRSWNDYLILSTVLIFSIAYLFWSYLGKKIDRIL